jgi:hypothetical protein
MPKKNIAIILFVSLGVAVLASFFASSHPDGLEWAAERLGFLNAASGTLGIMPNYSCPFVKSAVGSTVIAGVLGALVVFGVFFIAREILRRAG